MVMMVADTYLPVSLSVPGITDEQFQDFCEQYADYRLEYTVEGELLIMPPTDPETGVRNAIITEELSRWARANGRGFATDSSAGFKLPSGARLAPDAAWISRDRFARKPICPEFVIELVSPSDKLKKVQAKMREWVSNGVELGWMIDPRTQSVTIYRPNRDSEVLAGAASVVGEGPIAGFVLDLTAIWAI